MAANDYYNSNRYNDNTTPSSYPPSYTSQPTQSTSYYKRPTASPAPAAGAASSTVSPFETVFDDHVYPVNPNATSNGMGSQHTFAQDTRYHSAASGDVSPVGDDIPLQHHQDNTVKMGAVGFADSSTDHVYDTGVNEQPREGRRGKLRYGELGMLGSQKRRVPLVVYIFTLAQIGVFIGELVKAAQLTGSPIETSPSFNPMIGPSQYVLINFGSRFVACMHNVDGIQNSNYTTINWPCPWTTTSDTSDSSNQCTLSELCGFGGVPEPHQYGSLNDTPFPNQWWRFILPMFMHAGFVHIGFNLLLQLTLGKEIERAIGSIRFFLVYVSSGIFGFVMGGNFAATGISSTGASGALFGIIALTLLDLLYSWKDRRNPVRELMFIIIETLVSFVLGLLPGLDNYSHIGGFLMGISLGICVLHSPNALRERIGEDHFSNTAYSTVDGMNNDNGIKSVAFPPFLRNPVGFFKGRKGLWWAWWLVRAAFLIGIIVVFILLLNNFYVDHKTCSWCKYLSCLPVNGWCDAGSPTSTS
ncbi:hypothetical protein BX600DRAFT_506318 [Xylariales sp. PMI_506]|nr:hypothetical protein BX600DRAFT_506318 [Xylariales sp. PMI_506]